MAAYAQMTIWEAIHAVATSLAIVDEIVKHVIYKFLSSLCLSLTLYPLTWLKHVSIEIFIFWNKSPIKADEQCRIRVSVIKREGETERLILSFE